MFITNLIRTIACKLTFHKWYYWSNHRKCVRCAAEQQRIDTEYGEHYWINVN